MEEESPALFPTPSPHAQGPEASATKRGEGMATDTDALATPVRLRDALVGMTRYATYFIVQIKVVFGNGFVFQDVHRV